MITLYKGDDTAGQLGKKCIIKFHCDDAVDMTNVTVKFNLLNIVTKEFTNVHDGDELEVFASHVNSRKLPLGIVYGKLWGEDSSGKIRTFANRIPFKLTTDLRCVYGSDGLDSVDVHVYSSVDWDAIANKPTLFPSKVSMVEGLEEALKQAGKVKTVNGQSPDENGNIEIEPPSCKVTSVNGKDGDVELTAQDIPYGVEGASNIETAIEQNAQAIDENADAIDSIEQQVGELQTNTYTKSEVDDKINQSAAHYLTKRTGTEGHYSYPQFATHADLAAAKAAHTEANPQFFYGVEGHTPDKNDYCVVLADETHNGSTTRYAFVGEWDDNGYFRYQYTINQTAFTEEQWAAINSLTSIDEDGNLCFDGIPFINSRGELLFTEEDPIFTAWKNEVQIILGSGANAASGKYKQIAIGAHATANGQNAIALGSSEPGGKTNGPRATAQNAIAIGAGAIASAVNAIQILAGTNNTSGTMQIGNKRVAFVSDIPISQADIDDYRYYKGHWDMSVTYKTGDIVRAERTVEGQEEKEVTYFKSLKDNNRANNPFTTPTYWSVTTDDEGLEKLTLFVKAAIATLTGADIPVSPTNSDSIEDALGKKLSISDIGQHQFPPELVSDLNTRPSDEDAGKTASAQEIFDKLEKKVTHFGNGNGTLFVQRDGDVLYLGAYGIGIDQWIKLPYDGKQHDGGVFALVSQLSGITAQDITDFLHYKGEIVDGGDYSLTYNVGDVLYSVNTENQSETGFWRCIYNCARSPYYEPPSWEFIYAKNEGKTGLERLIDLFGKSNSRLVNTIEAKAVKVLAYEKREGDDKEYLYDGDTKLTSYAKFIALVQSGRVVLRATATPSSGSSPVLFRPQLMNGNVVLFDATGEISDVMRTRNIQVKRSGTDGIEVVSGGLKQIALTSDISATNATFKAAVEAVFDNADTTKY